MALNFPDNPQTGDTYLAPNNQLYLYDGEKWIGFITPSGTVAQGITFVGDDSSGTRVSDGESFKIAGAGSVTTGSGDTLTITGPQQSHSSGDTIKIAGSQDQQRRHRASHSWEMTLQAHEYQMENHSRSQEAQD
jgi:hypothetical protein